MTLVPGGGNYGELSIEETAGDGTWVRWGLIPLRPRYFLEVLEPLSPVVLEQNPQYTSRQRLINLPYRVTLGQSMLKEGYIRAKNQALYLPQWIMTGVELELNGGNRYEQLNWSRFGLQIWKPLDQDLKLVYYGLESW
jgi:hypothetical protein